MSRTVDLDCHERDWNCQVPTTRLLQNLVNSIRDFLTFAAHFFTTPLFLVLVLLPPSTSAAMPNLLLKSLPSPTPMHDLPIYPSPTGHSSLKLKLLPSKPIYLAGERVTGMLEVGVSSDALALGEIGIEFSAFEGE